MTIGSQKDTITAIGTNGFVSAADVRTLRQQIFADGLVSRDEIGALLALAERAPDGDPEWADYFGEAAGDYYLREEIPHDYITEREFTELKALVTQFGPVVTPLVLSMLVKLMDDATATPPGMTDFVCDQIKAQLIARAEKQTNGDVAITAQDAALIRKFLFAMGGDGNIAVTQKEAMLMFDINDMTISKNNDPAWSDLFIKAISNHLMAHIGYTAPSREEALAQYQWVSDHSVSVGGFFDRMISGGLSAVRELYSRKDTDSSEKKYESIYDEVLDTRERLARESEAITGNEADWLAERIGRDGVLDDNERALLAYMAELKEELPVKLQALLDRAA
ncbi:MAG: hypothetical protein AAFY83_03290 [Pseudomonadota bacterium]